MNSMKEFHRQQKSGNNKIIKTKKYSCYLLFIKVHRFTVNMHFPSFKNIIHVEQDKNNKNKSFITLQTKKNNKFDYLDTFSFSFAQNFDKFKIR